MKKLIIAIIALLLVGGSSFAAYIFFNKPAEATETSEVATAKAVDLMPPSYVELKPLVLPVLDRNGVSQIVSIVVSLEVENAEKAAQAEALKPRLTDAYIQAMYGALSSSTVMEDGVLQVGTIKEKLNKITDKVLGEHQVKDVLLQVVQQRRV